MGDSKCLSDSYHISLSEILELQGQPVSEEQAWALCYQLCSLMVQSQRLQGCGDLSRWKAPWITGMESVLLKNDGTVVLKTKERIKGSFELQTEDDMVDFLGRMIYSCLDWGLGSNVERDLSETLEILICQMTKLDTSHNRPGEPFQPVCTFSEVIQVCEARLYSPAMAAHHYRAICSILFAETVDICRYLQKIQNAKETLQKLVNKSDGSIVTPVTTDWVFTWKHVIEELRTGVKLKSRSERRNVTAPAQAPLSPYEQLLRDIQSKRYTLRKVKTVGNLPKRDPHEALLDFVRSNPRLRPASDRKLKKRPKEAASLHELLMEEIRSAAKLQPLSSHRRRAACQENNTSPPNCVISVSVYEDSFSDDSFCLLKPIPTPDLKESGSEEDSRYSENSDEKLCENASNKPDRDLKFFPLLSSSPIDLLSNPSGHRKRSKSFDSFELEKKVCLPLTIADVIRVRQAEMGRLQNLSYNSYTNLRVCACCQKRSLYFTWHNSCYFCNRVVCPECCIEMLLPNKWCMNLPVSFFKKIVVTKEALLMGQDIENTFWQERWSWDSTRVPLVLESRVIKTAPQHRLAMKDWYSKDICVRCKNFLVEACDAVLSLRASPVPREI
ncbi:protein spire homolog 1 isoform X1 [Lepisosteus oculatus]|uniref:protein spire homolog 1 isoform X1 n=1 Tax=Lepisosteus oculatus TaxID=7918 RepID=UPI0035F51C90